MTQLLVSVRNVEEARAAVDAGAEIIDAKDPDKGALGALSADVVQAIVAAVGERAKVSAAVDGDTSAADLAAIAASGVAFVKTAVPDDATAPAFMARMVKDIGTKTRLIAVFAADRDPDEGMVPIAAMAGFSGVMLDTVDKSAGLLASMEIADLAHFVAAARRAKVMVGLAGSLQVVDVGTLLPLKPDLLGFRGGVCRAGERGGVLDPARVRAVAAALKVHAQSRDMAG